MSKIYLGGKSQNFWNPTYQCRKMTMRQSEHTCFPNCNVFHKKSDGEIRFDNRWAAKSVYFIVIFTWKYGCIWFAYLFMDSNYCVLLNFKHTGLSLNWAYLHKLCSITDFTVMSYYWRDIFKFWGFLRVWISERGWHLP